MFSSSADRLLRRNGFEPTNEDKRRCRSSISWNGFQRVKPFVFIFNPFLRQAVQHIRHRNQVRLNLIEVTSGLWLVVRPTRPTTLFIADQMPTGREFATASKTMA
jgi:hypothetical protein